MPVANRVGNRSFGAGTEREFRRFAFEEDAGRPSGDDDAGGVAAGRGSSRYGKYSGGEYGSKRAFHLDRLSLN